MSTACYETKYAQEKERKMNVRHGIPSIEEERKRYRNKLSAESN